MADSDDPVSIQAELGYREPRRAMEWLAQAFGFEPSMIVTDDKGRISIIMMNFGDGTVSLGQAEGKDPVGGASLHVRGRIPGAIDVKAHCERARAHGATILQEPEQAFWGDLSYMVADLEGRTWRFSQHVEGTGGSPPAGWKVEFLAPHRH